ncbi:MAG: ATP-binding cassette domain-containing protein [Streptosporangiales bacterium]|nr:ATP-binding cassette domain-containing protein [Streptosporangiales bacterium]
MRIRVRRAVLDFVWLLPQADRPGTLALAAQIVAAGLLPVALMLATAAVIAAVSTGRSPLPGGTWGAVAALAAVLVTFQVVVPLLGPATERLAHRLDLLLRMRMLRAVLAPPTLAHLEDPKLADELAQARTVGTEEVQTPLAVGALSAVAATRLMAAGSAVVLAGYSWWAPVALLACWVATNEAYRRGVARLISSLEGATPGFRRARYLSDLSLNSSAAKELRLFGLAGWLADRFETYWRAGMREVWSRRSHRRGVMLAAVSVLIAGHALVAAALVRSALAGDLGAAELALYLQAIIGMAGFGWDADRQYVLRLGVAPVPHALRVSAAASDTGLRLPGSRTPPADMPRDGIRFQDVSFAYPRTERNVVRRLDLGVPAGRSLAIVGVNGSGKTTLLKLLCRFYDPGEGSVTVDGVDLRELDAAAWQRRVAALFQDFARYPLPARDNVALGDIGRGDDDDAVGRAAAAAGVADVVERLPARWDTPLSREFEGGIEPSGGQWQRLALARVLFAIEGGAGVLILDEPTAHLDIRAEAAFYDRFLDLTRGRTTIVVSHRFSTVRHADHIVVLDGGRVVEAGSHPELMALGGRYAAMFDLQAAVYRQGSGRA